MKNIKLIAGLANPGAKYNLTRHNAGAWFIETMLLQHQANLQENKNINGRIAKINFANQDVLLLIPNSFMNNSGQVIRKAMDYYKIDATELMVVHDEIELEVGRAKYKLKGGHGGHNGLRSIIEHLGGNKDFYRLRIGVGRPVNATDVANYVLSKPQIKEYDAIQEIIIEATATTRLAFEQNINTAMNKLHSVNALLDK